MGRALGVLHTTGPEDHALSGEAVSQLSVLAGQAGSRIGTVRAFEKTQLQASTDGLTGLVNRRTAEKELRALMKADRPFAVAFADLDRFKQLNDTHGHEAGDRALRLFSQIVDRALRDSDVIARWGGEEFVIVLPELDRFQAVAVLERIREDLAAAHSRDHASLHGELRRRRLESGEQPRGAAEHRRWRALRLQGGRPRPRHARRPRVRRAGQEGRTRREPTGTER